MEQAYGKPQDALQRGPHPREQPGDPPLGCHGDAAGGGEAGREGGARLPRHATPRHALPRRPASRCAAAPPTGCPRGSHYPHSIRGANGRRRQASLTRSHTLPGRGPGPIAARGGRGGSRGRTNGGRRGGRPRPPGPAPEPGEVKRGGPAAPARVPVLAAGGGGRRPSRPRQVSRGRGRVEGGRDRDPPPLPLPGAGRDAVGRSSAAVQASEGWRDGTGTTRRAL